MIKRILKAIPTLLRSLGKPGLKSALVVPTGQPVAATGGNAKSASVSDRDSHMLAEIYLRERGKDKGTLTLRFYQGQYWRWAGFCYRALRNAQLRAEVTRSVKKHFDEQGDKSNKPILRVTTSLVTNVVQALSDLTLVDGKLDQPVLLKRNGHSDPNLVSMANGLVDLDGLLEGKAITLREHTPNWFSTVSLPYPFDVQATCPKWEAFLNEVLECDEERIHLLQEWFGYCLTRNTGEQKFVVMEGEGANGKSVVCEILTAMLGDANVSHVPLELFGERFQLAATVGKLANIASEVEELKGVAEGYLKQFTAGDRMQFERKGLDPFEARPTARLVLATNNRPRFSDRSSGVWRRLLLIPFNITIPTERQNPNLSKELRAELPGIFNWAVQGERRRGEQGGFTKSRVCAEALGEYKEEMNPARIFFLERVEADPDATVLSSELFAAYKTWCSERGYKPLPDVSFGKEIRRQFGAGVTRHKGSGAKRENYYRGVRLLPSNAELVEPDDAEFLASVRTRT